MRMLPENRAMAQANRRPADYLMVPASISGLSVDVVYIVDSNGMLGALVYNDSNNSLDTMPAIDLNRVFQAGMPSNPQRKLQK
jgi:hypothetical protein